LAYRHLILLNQTEKFISTNLKVKKKLRGRAWFMVEHLPSKPRPQYHQKEREKKERMEKKVFTYGRSF
jgi:hypothetical protein